MALILHLETTSKNCSVSISKGLELVCLCEEISDNFSSNEKLHTFINWALEGAEISINGIDAISVSKGPGSYTGLRIGVAAAKGLCFALDKPLIALNTLEILIQNQKYKNFENLIPVIDARRLELYTTIFDGRGISKSLIEAHILTANSFESIKNDSNCFIGDAAKKTQDFFKENNLDFSQSIFIEEFPSSKNMIESIKVCPVTS